MAEGRAKKPDYFSLHFFIQHILTNFSNKNQHRQDIHVCFCRRDIRIILIQSKITDRYFRHDSVRTSCGYDSKFHDRYQRRIIYIILFLGLWCLKRRRTFTMCL